MAEFIICYFDKTHEVNGIILLAKYFLLQIRRIELQFLGDSVAETADILLTLHAWPYMTQAQISMFLNERSLKVDPEHIQWVLNFHLGTVFTEKPNLFKETIISTHKTRDH